MKRLLAAGLGVALIGLAALAVYSFTGRALELARANLTGLERPVSDDGVAVTFRVENGQTAADIGAALEQRRLIRSARLFRLMVERDGLAERMVAGDYELSPALSTPEVIAILAQGRVRRGSRLTVPEGWRAEEIAWKLDGMIPGSGPGFLERVFDDPELGERLGLPRGASLEGFLFPETYELPRDGTMGPLVEAMVAQFERRFDGERRAAAARQGLSALEAVTLASIVEREAVIADERPLIAAVFLNRLALGMRLQADPTVQYALAPQAVPSPAVDLWPRDLSLKDLELVSPYNTYHQAGLPPGPICSPGLPALDAVLRPASSDALYFVARGDGSHIFARTLDEHHANVRRYQSGPRH